MTEQLHLKSFMENPDLFDKKVAEYAVQMLEELKESGALIVDPNDLAQMGFENLKKEGLDAEVYEMLTLPYVKKHFFTVFTDTVKDWQRQKLINNYADFPRRLGEQYELVIDQNGQAAIEIVVLDENTLDVDEAQLVYRYNDRETKEEWFIGTIGDAVNECLQRREL